MKKFLSTLAIGALVAVTNASAAYTAPDMSGVVTDIGTAFGAVMTLVIAVVGFRYIKKMFA